MHFMPGGVILRSYDLIHWEIASYVFENLDDTPAQRLEDGKNIYGKGMWAASLRFHNNTFYVCFVANDTKKTYLYQSDCITGPWKKQNIEGFYHDSSLLFDEDRVYIVHGNREIHLTELNSDLTAPKLGGLNRIIIREKGNVVLGYEGAHMYKINGKYYVFLIHWPADGNCRRTEACFVSDTLEGEFIGRDILDDDMGYHNFGVAQGGIVDTPDGDWYAMLFQDHGAIGRIPVLVPIHWEERFPVFGIDGKVPHHIETKSTRPDYCYTPLVDSDDFRYDFVDDKGKASLKNVWQWNHVPSHELWSVDKDLGSLRIQSDHLSTNVLQARNTLTQRMCGPTSEAIVNVDGSFLKDGDYTGVCAFQGCYGLIALTKEGEQYYLVMLSKAFNPDENIWGEPGGDKNPGKEYARVPIESNKVTLKISTNFVNNEDTADFYYLRDDKWEKLGITHQLYFRLDHFTGCRFGLFLFSTKNIGGATLFSNFIYKIRELF
jgi:beta-xylosidase